MSYLQPNNLDGFVWANSLHDVYTRLEDDKKQVIILDDFWGSIFHGDHTRRNDENRLNKLIRRIIESNGQKRLILTTREYILQQGLQKHPALKETLQQYGLVCTMEEYGDDEKASILFRHLYASNLEYDYVNYLYMNCNWIVHHQNYNPRVLSLFLDKGLDKDFAPKDYHEELCEYFDNPDAFWKSIFLELSPEAQIVALLLLISSTPMRLTDMECCYQKYIHSCTVQAIVKNLGDSISELEKTMVKSFYSEDEEAILLKFSMPAVQDFLYMYIKENNEQYIPLILQCCTFYNQLQFLLEYQSMHCSKKVTDLIVQQCILHYHDYNDSYMEYDGSWNWDMDIFDEHGYLHRFFHLLRCCEPKRHPALFRFLETQIKDYCSTMGSNDHPTTRYTDLHDLPDIIVRCVKKGMIFNGKDIIDKYYEGAFSVYHYRAMKKFQEAFPDEYSIFYNTYFHKIKKKLKNIILSEIELLDYWGMDFELDTLLDSIPDLLQEFGLRYTNSFEEKIFFLCGIKPMLENNKETIDEKSLQDYVDREEVALEAIKEDAGNWLLGPNETHLNDEQIVEIISNSSLNMPLKAELMKILDTEVPQYVYDFLQTKESLELLLATLYDFDSGIPNQESTLMMIMLRHIAQGNQEWLKKLIGFCAESFIMIMYGEEPVLRTNQFLSSEIYASYLQTDTQLREVVFENLIIKDEQWIRFLHIPLFIFCNAFIMHMGQKDEELEEYYYDLWGENFSKFKHIVRYDWGNQTDIYYADFGTYYFKRYDWEGCMYRMFEELNPFHFNQTYVEPMLKNYLDKLGNEDDDSKVLKHISLCRMQIEYDEAGFLHSLGYEISDELNIIEHLSIAEDWDTFPEQIMQSKLKMLKKDESICQKNDRWKIYLYKIEDIDLLKELGIYDSVIKFIQDVENVYSRFLYGDYSQIKKRA